MARAGIDAPLQLALEVIRTAAEPRLLRYLTYPIGLLALAGFLTRNSVFANARARGNGKDGSLAGLFGLAAVASAALAAYYFVLSSAWSFEEFQDRAHLVGNLISPLPPAGVQVHPLVLLLAHIRRSIDWLWDSQPLTEALKLTVAHPGVWWWTSERLALIAGAWLVLLQAEGHRVALPYRPLYAILALLGPLSLALALFFLALVVRMVPNGTLSNSAEFILAADPKGSFHALQEAGRASAARDGHSGAEVASYRATTNVTSTRSRRAPSSPEQHEQVIEERRVTEGELDLDPPAHVLSHLSLWVAYFISVVPLFRGRDVLDVAEIKEHYAIYALGVLAPFLLPLVLRLPTALPTKLAKTLEHLHDHLKDGWFFLALGLTSVVIRVANTRSVWAYLHEAVPPSKVNLALFGRFVLLGRPVVLGPSLHLVHPPNAVPPAAQYVLLDTYLASALVATWILLDRARLARAGAFPASQAHLSVLLVLLGGPAAGLSLWAHQRESQLAKNEVRDERRLGRRLHLGGSAAAAAAAELKHRVPVQQQTTKVTTIRSEAPLGQETGVGAQLAPPSDATPALATLSRNGNGNGNGYGYGYGYGQGVHRPSPVQVAEAAAAMAAEAAVASAIAAHAGTGTSTSTGVPRSRAVGVGRASGRRQATLSPGLSDPTSAEGVPAPAPAPASSTQQRSRRATNTHASAL